VVFIFGRGVAYFGYPRLPTDQEYTTHDYPLQYLLS